MAHVLLRSKQAGVDSDLSAGLGPDLFAIDDVRIRLVFDVAPNAKGPQINRYGINSKISQITYDPVQSLLAIGTSVSQFGPGQIYIFGQSRVCVVLPLPRNASVKSMQFCADKLLCLDSKNDLSLFSLETKKRLATHSPPGVVTAIHTDPCLEYAFLGMQNGQLVKLHMHLYR